MLHTLFDWLFGAPLKNRLELLLSNFEGFLDKKYLVHLEKNPNCINDYKNEYYKNIKNEIIFLHDFPASMTFEEGYELVFEKYQRRKKGFMKKLKNPKKFFLFGLERPKA